MLDEIFNLFVENQGNLESIATPPGSLPKTIDVVIGGEKKSFPLSYLWRDVLVPGTYRKHATGQVLSIDAPKLEKMLQTFRSYLQNGNQVPIPLKDHNDTKNVGFCVDGRIQNGRLQLLHQFIGADATLEALRNHVSVQIHRRHRDPRNNEYNDCIVHSSLTDTPVVTGQGSWAPLAASRGKQEGAPNYVFAASRRSNMDLKTLRTLLGLAEDVSEDDVIKKAEEKIAAAKALETEKTSLSQKVTDLTAEKTNLNTQLQAKSSEMLQLSQKNNPVKPTPQELYYGKVALMAARDKAITSGACDAAMADKIIKRKLGELDLNTISLSRNVTDADISLSANLASTVEVFDLLDGNKPGPKSGEKSGNQGAAGAAGTTTTPAADKKKDGDTAAEEENLSDEEKERRKKLPKSSKEVVGSLMSQRYKGPPSAQKEAAKA